MYNSTTLPPRTIFVSLRKRTGEERRRQNTCVWQTWQGYYVRVLSWSGPLQKDLFKGKWSLAKSCFKQNYCHACHTRFAVVFPLPSCCVSSLLPHTAHQGEISSRFSKTIRNQKISIETFSPYLPSQILDSVFREYPFGQSQENVPGTFWQIPPWQRRGSSRHSSISNEKS